MSRRRFATRSLVAATSSLQALLDRTPGARPPMDVALVLAHDVLRAAAEVHAQGRTCGPVDAASFEVDADGALCLRGEAGGTDVLQDVHAVGVVLYQLFTGVTPAQARARLQVARRDEVPAPSRLNPALDDALDTLVASMVAADPAERPYSLAYVLADVLNVMDDVGLEADVALVAAWAGLREPAPVAAPAPVVKVVPVVAAVVAKKAPRREPPRSWQTDDAENDDSEDDDAQHAAWAEPVRFDGWTVLAACFALASLAIAFNF
ncbi:MAG: hypothetical protein AB1730_23060 [Myxococcota bacterium]|jgi:hypothetical protein